MWSLYRCPHCQAIRTGKEWSSSTLTNFEKKRPIDLHKPNAELNCPSCKEKVPTKDLIILWEMFA